MSAKGNDLGQTGLLPARLGTQAPYILAMHTGQQADPAVARRLVVQAKLALGDIDEYLLEQLCKARVGDPLPQHQPHQGPHDTLQRRQ
ncbi:hypothetical protein D3C78_1679450 [compost metagenome]